MKNHTWFVAIIASGLALSALAQGEFGSGTQDSVPKERGKVHVQFGGNLTISPGYMDFIEENYEDKAGYTSVGGFGWVGLYGGLEFEADDRFSLIAGCDFLFNGVDVTGGPLDETYLNTLLTPSLFGRIYLDNNRMFYISGGFILPIINSGSDAFEFEGDGIGFGGNLGLAFADGMIQLEGGFTHIPVSVKGAVSNPASLQGELGEYNFGGLQGRIIISF